MEWLVRRVGLGQFLQQVQALQRLRFVHYADGIASVEIDVIAHLRLGREPQAEA